MYLFALLVQVACETFCVGNDCSLKDATVVLTMTDYSWSPDKFRLMPVDGEREPDLCDGNLILF